MSILRRFYDYLGVSDTTITGEQIFNLICLLAKERCVINITPDPVRMMECVLELYIWGLETNSFKNITEQDILEVLK